MRLQVALQREVRYGAGNQYYNGVLPALCRELVRVASIEVRRVARLEYVLLVCYLQAQPAGENVQPPLSFVLVERLPRSAATTTRNGRRLKVQFPPESLEQSRPLPRCIDPSSARVTTELCASGSGSKRAENETS